MAALQDWWDAFGSDYDQPASPHSEHTHDSTWPDRIHDQLQEQFIRLERQHKIKQEEEEKLKHMEKQMQKEQQTASQNILNQIKEMHDTTLSAIREGIANLAAKQHNENYPPVPPPTSRNTTVNDDLLEREGLLIDRFEKILAHHTLKGEENLHANIPDANESIVGENAPASESTDTAGYRLMEERATNAEAKVDRLQEEIMQLRLQLDAAPSSESVRRQAENARAARSAQVEAESQLRLAKRRSEQLQAEIKRLENQGVGAGARGKFGIVSEPGKRKSTAKDVALLKLYHAVTLLAVAPQQPVPEPTDASINKLIRWVRETAESSKREGEYRGLLEKLQAELDVGSVTELQSRARELCAALRSSLALLTELRAKLELPSHAPAEECVAAAAAAATATKRMATVLRHLCSALGVQSASEVVPEVTRLIRNAKESSQR